MKIPDRQDALESFHREHLADKPTPVVEPRSNGHPLNDPGLPDTDVIEKLLGERTDKGRRLWSGDTSGFDSPSEADMSLLDKLAFYTQDAEQLDRLWLTSGLAREKISRRPTLRFKTINKALERVTETYEWNPKTIPIRGLSRARGAPTMEGVRSGAHTTGDESENGSAPVQRNPFVRADLSAPLKEGVPPPEVLYSEILLAGKVHSIYSAGGTGKTFVMVYLMVELIRQGKPVIIFDLENGLRIIAERLQLFRVTSEEAELIHYYPFPTMPLEAETVQAFEDLLDEIDPALVVFDSWVNCLAACGLDENKSTDIAGWADAYSQKARMRNSAVLILDHIPKEGNTARGSGRKLDYVDVQFELRNPQPFDRQTVGRIDLHLKKDREGWLPKHIVYSVGGGSEGFVFKRSAGVFTKRDEEGLTAAERGTLGALRDLGLSGGFDKEWRAEAEARGIARRSYYRAKEKLIGMGLVDEEMNKFFLANEAREDEREDTNTKPQVEVPSGDDGIDY